MPTKVKDKISLSEIRRAYQLAISKINNGNLLTFGTTTYAYDYRNRLVSAGNGIATSTYAYDQNGQRIKVTNSSTNHSTLYPTKYYNAEYDGGSNLTKQTSHTFAGDTLLTTLETKTLDFSNYGTCAIPSTGDFTLSASCTIIGTVLAPASIIVPSGKVLTVNATSTLLVDFKHKKLLVQHGGGTLIKKGGTVRQVKAGDTAPQLYYDLTDHLGSVVVSTDSKGAITELSDYYPYGNVRLDTKTGLSEQRKYIGQEFDAATNLSYLNARYYDGARGQFLSEDPVFWSIKQNITDPQSLNSYSYANNNPIAKSDPTGKCAEDLCIGEAIVVTSPYWGPVAAETITNLIGAVAIGASGWINSRTNPGQRKFIPFSQQKGREVQSPDSPSLFPDGKPPEVPDSKWLRWGLAGTLIVDAISGLHEQVKNLIDFIQDYNNKIQTQSNSANHTPSYQNNTQSQSSSVRGGQTVFVQGSNIPRSKEPVEIYNGQPVYCWGVCSK